MVESSFSEPVSTKDLLPVIMVDFKHLATKVPGSLDQAPLIGKDEFNNLIYILTLFLTCGLKLPLNR
jgi:hypothetical protein